ncbi:MAG: Dyp-type peroxidase [Elainella sp. Prado103]|nr:Dyp-type peroxidase [Elainella sp. Prado103]
MEKLDLEDIQGIIVYGYGKLAAARYLLLQITDRSAGHDWLSSLVDRITSAARNPSVTGQSTCLNLALTASGLTRLGLAAPTLDQFADEFQEGMTFTPHRQRILGDQGESAPEYWQWGGTTTPRIDLLLMLYAIDESTLEQFYQTLVDEFVSHGIQEVKRLDTQRLPDRKEHFGFRDDISDPIIAGTERTGTPENTINAGEFILGYRNGYGQYTNRPLISPDHDPEQLLPIDSASGLKDLGRNGSYLVFRQLHQDVRAFWQFLDQQSRGAQGEPQPQTRLKLAAQMVGRWTSGAPLVATPQQDNADLAEKNDFLYHASDPQGLKCPFGAHIRRVNPRDALEPNPGSAETLNTTNRHRILRRGRTYGQPLAGSMQPEDMLNAEAASNPDLERGIHFICFNANISRQFEFIQHTWVNNPKFDGLYNDDDPLIGDRGQNQTHGVSHFTVQAAPVRKCIAGLPRFVQVRGGSYFFMPGIKAIRFLSQLI